MNISGCKSVRAQSRVRSILLRRAKFAGKSHFKLLLSPFLRCPNNDLQMYSSWAHLSVATTVNQLLLRRVTRFLTFNIVKFVSSRSDLTLDIG